MRFLDGRTTRKPAAPAASAAPDLSGATRRPANPELSRILNFSSITDDPIKDRMKAGLKRLNAEERTVLALLQGRDDWYVVASSGGTPYLGLAMTRREGDAAVAVLGKIGANLGVCTPLSVSTMFDEMEFMARSGAEQAQYGRMVSLDRPSLKILREEIVPNPFQYGEFNTWLSGTPTHADMGRRRIDHAGLVFMTADPKRVMTWLVGQPGCRAAEVPPLWEGSTVGVVKSSGMDIYVHNRASTGRFENELLRHYDAAKRAAGRYSMGLTIYHSRDEERRGPLEAFRLVNRGLQELRIAAAFPEVNGNLRDPETWLLKST